MTGLQAFQTAFGARLRGGRSVPCPPGVSAPRMAVYETLLFNNLRGFVDRCFPVARACLGEARWTRLCRSFYRDWPCRSAWFRDIPRAFVDYLESAAPAGLPRWLADLARYEWAELAVDLMDVAQPPVEAGASLLDDFPQPNPAALSLAFAWPVQRIGPDFRPRRPAPVCIVVYRDGSEAVRFIELSSASARLLALCDGATRGRAAIETLAAELGRAADPAFVAFGAHNLAALADARVILGARR